MYAATTVVNGIAITEREAPPALIELQAGGRLLLNDRFTSDFRLRAKVAAMLADASTRLPDGLCLMIFEAYRPRSRQVELWNAVVARLRHERPDIADADLHDAACQWVSDPYGFGSGHQAAAAIDVTLCDSQGRELAMGTNVQEFSAWTRTEADGLPRDFAERRTLLREVLEGAGIVNYPPEWWHFSYGDRLWAEVTGRTDAFFAPLD